MTDSQAQTDQSLPRAGARIPVLSRPFFRAAMFENIAGGVVAGAILPFVGVMARHLGASPRLLALLAMAPFFGFLLGSFAARVAYRVSWGKAFGILGIAANALLILFIGIRSAMPFVLAIVAMQALAGCKHVFFGSLLKSNVHERVQAPLLKWLRVLAMAVSLPAAWLVGRALDTNPTDYRVIFPVVGVLAMLLHLPALTLRRRCRENEVRDSRCGLLEEWNLLRHDRRFLAFMIAFFIGTLAEKIAIPITPIYFVDVLHLRYEDVALATGIVGPALAAVGYLYWGHRLKATAGMRILMLCMFLKALRPVLWALAPTVPTPLALVTLGEALFRVNVTGLELASIMVVLQMSARGRVPVYLGIHYLFMGVRGILGPIIGLALYEAGVPIETIYWLIAAIVFAGGLAMWRLNHTTQGTNDDETCRA